MSAACFAVTKGISPADFFKLSLTEKIVIYEAQRREYEYERQKLLALAKMLGLKVNSP